MSIIELSVRGAVFIAVILILRGLITQFIPKKAFVILWLIASMRLIIPVSVASRFSIYGLWQSKSLHYALSNDAESLGLINAQKTMLEAGKVTGEAVMDILTIIWIAAAILLLAWFTAVYISCRRKFMMSLPLDNAAVTACLSELNFTGKAEVRISDMTASPLAYGFFKPVILLPKSMNLSDTETLKYVLAHECVHIRRFDSLVKLIFALTLCVHWFNPLVWAMYIIANRDLELSCDETVIHIYGEEEKSRYALALINMEEHKILTFSLYSNFSKTAIEERIKAIMKIKKTSAVGIMLAVLAVAGTTTIFATSSPDSKGNEDIPFTSFTSNDGEKQPINESNVVTAKKYSFDGNKLSLEISESESGDADDWTNYIIADADEDGTPVYMFDEDGKKYELPESLKDIAEQFSKMAKTYTDEELDKIIADIEVGKYPEYEYSDDAEVTLIFAD